MSTPSSQRISSISDPWRVIHNPVTGEIATFLESSSRRCVFELVLPPGKPSVPVHSHPGLEGFRTVQGTLRLLVDGTIHDLAVGDQWAVTTELHSPRNATDEPVVVVVTCEPGDMAERGIRGIFGLSAEGRVRKDGRPRDLLAMALLTEHGKYYMPMMPRPVWRTLMTVLAAVGTFVGKRRILERYWPPELPRP